MNAIYFLVKEHNRVRKQLAKISEENHNSTTKVQMFNELCQDLLRHEIMEQELWYPHFKNNEKLKKEVKHLISEENKAEKLLKTFEAIKNAEDFEYKFNKFRSEVEHHANEEETKLFPNVMEILDEQKLEQIGKEMHSFKSEFKKSKFEI